MKLITIGDNVVDCYLDQNLYYPGGNCINTAVSAKRNGAHSVSYIGIFGSDDKSSAIRQALDQEQIEQRYARYAIGSSGQPAVTLQQGERVFVGGPQDTVQHRFKLQLTEEELKYCQSFDICHTSTYSQILEELPALSRHVPISFDFSENLTSEYLQKTCPFISCAFFSGATLSQAECLAKMQEIASLGVPLVIVTQGSRAVLALEKQVRRTFAVPEITVIDTMGAGDSFIGAFLVSISDTHDLAKAVAAGIASSQQSCQHYGAFGYPHLLTSE